MLIFYSWIKILLKKVMSCTQSFSVKFNGKVEKRAKVKLGQYFQGLDAAF